MKDLILTTGSRALYTLCACVLLSCGREADGVLTVRFWALGAEGDNVRTLIPEFERRNPGIRVVVQAIPWTAAHEKLLTAHVGGSTPDAAQLGNTWIAEFAALRATEPLPPWLAASRDLDAGAYFPGIWDTNVIEGVPYGVPWYVDTRVLFYRRDLLARAGYDTVPGDWAGWRRAMEAMVRAGGPGRTAIFLPTNEYTPWIVFGHRFDHCFRDREALRLSLVADDYHYRETRVVQMDSSRRSSRCHP